MSEEKKSRFAKGRSRLLYQITVLIVIVLVIIGVTLFLVVNGAFNRLIQKDKQDRMDSEAEIIYGDSLIISDLVMENMLTEFTEVDLADFSKAIEEKRIHDVIRYLNDGMRKNVEKGVSGAEALLLGSLDKQGLSDGPFIMAASDDELTFAEIPQDIVDAFKDGEHYIYKEGGVPQWGFEGEYLIIIIPVDFPGSLEELMVIGVRPFGEEIARISEFYNSEKNRLTIILALVIGGGIILVFLITFFILRRLIYRQITQPIDELTGVAEEVMGGNLDVEIDISEGEEFETLKRAFKEMLGSIRTIIEKSIGKQE